MRHARRHQKFGSSSCKEHSSIARRAARNWNQACFYPPAIIKQSPLLDRKSTRLNSSHGSSSYAVFCTSSRPPIYPLSLHDALPILRPFVHCQPVAVGSLAADASRTSSPEIWQFIVQGTQFHCSTSCSELEPSVFLSSSYNKAESAAKTLGGAHLTLAVGTFWALFGFSAKTGQNRRSEVFDFV